ncbi:MAG: phosphodiester glycosidase family protein [Clostridiales bacterium]|nr:phosphodiester glycosidase family protein [Clostridiales bacterium]
MKRKLFKRLTIGTAAAVFCLTSVMAVSANYLTASGTVSTTELTADVTYRQQKSASSPRGKQNLYSLTYDAHNPYYDLVLGGNVYGSQTTSSMAASLNAQSNYDVIGGVNGDFFSFANGIPMGFSMDDGAIVESPVTDTGTDGYMFYALGVTRDGEAVAGPNPTLIASCQKPGGSASVTIDRVNRTREWWNGAQLVLFTDKYGSSTHEESGGRELVINVTSGSASPQGGLRGTVASIVTGGNAAIGANQVVLSAEGDKATALQQYAVGDTIEMNFRFTDEKWNKVDFAIGGSYAIVVNGQAQTYSYGSAAGAFTAAAQRTAIGVKADGTVVLVATDGRGAGGGVGFTANDMSRVMAEDYGCQYAVLLDGGGSTTMVTKTSSGGYQVRNTLAAAQRSVGNGVFIARLTTPRSVPTTSMMPASASAVTGSENISAAYQGSKLVLTSTGTGGTVTFPVNKVYNVRQMPYLYLNLNTNAVFNMAFGIQDNATGGSQLNREANLSSDWGPSLGAETGKPIPAALFDNRRINFIGSLAWDNSVPADGMIKITSIRLYIGGAGTMTIDNMYMAPTVINNERGLNLMPRQGITTDFPGHLGATGILTPTYNANGSVTLTNNGTSWPSVKTVYNTTVDLNATPLLYYNISGIAADSHTGVNAMIYYGSGSSYLQLSSLVNGTVNDIDVNKSGSVDVRAYMRNKGIFPSDGKLQISYVTISVATWKAGSSAVLNTFRFGI